MQLCDFDHLVLTVTDIDATVDFYTRVLGMTAVLDGGRHELHFGKRKINLHARPGEFQPAARHPAPGSADICLVATGPMEAIVNDLRGVARIEMGPVQRTGGQGAMQAVYVRDPDGNLVEIAVYE